MEKECFFQQIVLEPGYAFEKEKQENLKLYMIK